MSQTRAGISGGTVSKIIRDASNGDIRPNGWERNIPTKASGFAQSYDIDVEVETTQTIHITGVQIVQSEVTIVEEGRP
ncbi:Oidioi.mRNA.OKI2018_I69.chr2.g4854.t1.cds [Oikopleura dioica]|uniref:Oidioi.mRNA.OKI2018_I69.chr2.g4854.t1.cds n=1 Tax=Oikopleura dioica TaxID=34765 RepID=A0ABN7SYK7_OIKDI|nr:Oidioi.mRNA.OKI2018_I69.chr2.g4854.t1.cds [Oikopleura dioica]